MTSPVDPVQRFYDALGRGDVAAGQGLLGENAHQQYPRHPDGIWEYSIL